MQQAIRELGAEGAPAPPATELVLGEDRRS